MRISDWSSDVCSSDLRDELRQSDVSYVIVYDNAGAVIHDGSSDISTYGQAMQDPLAFEAVAARDVHMQVQMEERLMDVSAPLRIGDQRIGGVRTGYSLESGMEQQQRATEAMQARMEAIGHHHARWIVLMMLVLV